MSKDPLMGLTTIEREAPDTPNDDSLGQRVRALTQRIESLAPAEAMALFDRMRAEYDHKAVGTRRTLLGTSLAWTHEEKNAARRVHADCAALMAFGHRLADILIRSGGVNDERTRLLIARTLFLMGEATKWEVVVTPEARPEYKRAHVLMLAVMAGGKHRHLMQMQVEGRAASCTLESLYFRMLLLARFAGGALNLKQIEILDAWMWMWMPVLSGVPDAPPGSALRVDLDSSAGLQRGPRADSGPSLYLPQGPIDRAYRALLKEFHAGRIVPSEGIASTFRIEEHVVVLGIIRHGLRASRQPVLPRAVRRAGENTVELLVGLAEISAHGMGSARVAAPAARPSILSLELEPGEQPFPQIDSAIDEAYSIKRRMVRLVDESDTGAGFEVSLADCGAMAPGDLVALRLVAGESAVPCKVVRCVPTKIPNRILVGVARLGAALQLVPATRSGQPAATAFEQIAFVAGEDRGGRQDAYLISDRTYTEAAIFTADLGGTTFAFRHNRARERGRGWVLAGFEVMDANAAAA